MSDDAEAAEASHVFHHIPRLSAQRIGRSRQTYRNVMAAFGAELDRIDQENPRAVSRRIWLPRAITMIGQDDELQPGPPGSGGHVFGRSGPIRTVRVNVKRAGSRGVGSGGIECEWFGWKWEQNKKKGGGQNGRRQDPAPSSQSPAALRSAAARSVRSHVKPSSLRPKCPNAAVFL